MTDTIGMREMLWNWARANPERAGDAVNWPRIAAFGREMASGHRESAEPVNYAEAEEVDRAVLSYLNAIRQVDKRSLEEQVFWARYFLRWEMPDVARKVKKSKAWAKNTCAVIEATIEGIYLVQQEKAA